MTNLIGPDVSFYQDDPNTKIQIDFGKMASLSKFVIIRAGQNLWRDPDVEYNWRMAKEAGLLRGSYWFYDSRAKPEQQADLWLAALNGDHPECGAWCDFEESYGGAYGMEKHFIAFLERVKDNFPPSVEVGVYTAPVWWGQHIKELTYWHQYLLWIANYKVIKPAIPAPWRADEWTFWQYTDHGDGKAYGAESFRIDLNYFNGDEKKLREVFRLPSAPEPPTIPPSTTTIMNIRITFDTSTSGTWGLKE